MRPFPRILGLFVLAFLFAFASCRQHEVCSGLNPEIGKYNTSKRLNKGGRSLKSKPERDSLRRRKKGMKKKNGFSAKGRYGGGFHIFGGGGGGKSKS